MERYRRSIEKNRERVNARRRELYALQPEVAAARQKRHRIKYPGKHNKSYRTRLRWEMLQAYGPWCACCGENHTEFLELDHIGGGGNAHRRAVGGYAGASLAVWAQLRTQGWPKVGYRILCSNCNMATTHDRACPHLLEAIDNWT